MIKTALKLVGLSAAGLAAYLYLSDRKPSEFAKTTYDSTKDKIQSFSNVLDHKNDFSVKLTQMQDELSKSKPTLEAMSRDISEYQFKIKPHLDLINQRINNMTK
ncbi:MAG: hypothetical protein M3005_00105 [Apilactobacillus sp.]|uniref:hypothetical protein n=1 Tax=Apilactobacillus TaxID=2767877 RepID=UPI0025DCA67D|nr:hypothetical protein [Apilactobacillus sp.]MCT6822257.1 hypothetical protein [Apilactobacillus sp.]